MVLRLHRPTMAKPAFGYTVALRSLVAVCAFAMTQGTAAVQQPSGVPRAPHSMSIETRAQQYWAKRQQRDLAGAYPFYCSSYKARVPLSDFLKQSRLIRFELKDVEVTHVEPVGQRMQVTVKYRFMAPTISPEPLPGETKEMWAREATGTWCKEDEPLVRPFPSKPSQ